MNVEVGTEIPEWDMPSVDAQRMKTMAAILRDPYEVHWDRAVNTRLGFGPRTINQGPLNLSYVCNMLMAWAGPTCIRSLTVAFPRPVFDEDHVVAHGRVSELLEVDGERRARCEIWLQRGDEKVLTGTAVVALPD